MICSGCSFLLFFMLEICWWTCFKPCVVCAGVRSPGGQPWTQFRAHNQRLARLSPPVWGNTTHETKPCNQITIHLTSNTYANFHDSDFHFIIWLELNGFDGCVCHVMPFQIWHTCQSDRNLYTFIFLNSFSVHLFLFKMLCLVIDESKYIFLCCCFIIFQKHNFYIWFQHRFVLTSSISK